jgi:hypothetical protein
MRTEFRDIATAIIIAVLAFGSGRTIAYAAGGQDAAFFAKLQIGDPVDDQPGCVWRWARDTVGPWGGWYHACATPGRVTAPPLVDAQASSRDCSKINPYADPEHATYCAALVTPPRPNVPTFETGRRYARPYPGDEMIVLAVGRTLDGVEVVTFQWLAPREKAGDVGACRNDLGTSINSCLEWSAGARP